MHCTLYSTVLVQIYTPQVCERNRVQLVDLASMNELSVRKSRSNPESGLHKLAWAFLKVNVTLLLLLLFLVRSFVVRAEPKY